LRRAEGNKTQFAGYGLPVIVDFSVGGRLTD